MRKPISISICIERGYREQQFVRTAVVCDDGTMWETGGANPSGSEKNDEWKQLPPIPQPETKTKQVPRLSVGPTHPDLNDKKPEDMHVNEDFKSYLQSIAHSLNLPLPTYRTEMEPGGAGMFACICTFDFGGETLSTTKQIARGKKPAEKAAAKEMVTVILPAHGFQNISSIDSD